ncbi:glutathione peroxidase [Kordiimonas sp. SCSIO 12603]|uniref:glutathione peroxidase n=1 Tax=Kordiimonas sp. SCSIO 12603 TaxID=2829596 RepID=UPI0021064BCA|nr:glutathione peroxidase [Kordiimonas sp. SCSIO 12603]UTW58133.1 glutathione peroxidase [Kordiimonas sp. SCSIO 12603]
MTSVHDFKMDRLTGKEQDLSEFKGKVMLIVNTASKCGLTPQFEGLEKLYKDLKDKGLVILGFPCNQFANQDPGSADEIGEFCQINYGVSFPMFAKIDVNGPDTAPLYEHLKAEKKGFLGTQKIKWNFTKFLVNKDGEVVKRFAPTAKPEAIRGAIEALL